ncbi:hypothetical protein, partial [Gordonibacter sp.]|uniref:hypothetical protein n=2 Tax=Gordonibacter sp. TaxID=1968902 RepID=UPI002FC8E0AC
RGLGMLDSATTQNVAEWAQAVGTSGPPSWTPDDTSHDKNLAAHLAKARYLRPHSAKLGAPHTEQRCNKV